MAKLNSIVKSAGSNLAEKTKQAGNWLLRNPKHRNYAFYFLNVFPVIHNPIRGVLGLAGRISEDIFTDLYAKNSHYIDLARLGLGAFTLIDISNYGGVFETFGDIALTSAFITDTPYWQRKSAAGIGDDIRTVAAKVRGSFREREEDL